MKTKDKPHIKAKPDDLHKALLHCYNKNVVRPII